MSGKQGKGQTGSNANEIERQVYAKRIDAQGELSKDTQQEPNKGAQGELSKDTQQEPNKGAQGELSKDTQQEPNKGAQGELSKDTQNKPIEREDIRFRAFAFSRKFFTAGIKEQFKSLDELNSDNYSIEIGKLKIEKDGSFYDINTVLQSMSAIYKDITTFPVCKDGKNNVQEHEYLKLTILKNENELGKHVIDIVKSHYPDTNAISGDKYILFMQGPVGSYKNRLLQYVYLSLCGEFANEQSKKAPVFYIDFSKYEICSEDFDIEKDIETIKGIINSHQVPPLFILDNVRGFEFGNITAIYSKFSREIIGTGDSKCIVSRDVEFSRMSSHDLSLPFGNAPRSRYPKETDEAYNAYKKEAYKNMINITSISTYNKDKCKSFLTNCIQYFALVGDVGSREQFNNVELFYQCLMSMEETKIDAYQIKLILGAMLQNSSDQIKSIVNAMLQNKSKNNINIKDIIGDIYDEIFKCIFNDTGKQQIKDNSQNVYEMAYGYENNSRYTINNENIAQWCKIIEHRSILDYCIAQYYIQQLTNDINKLNTQRSYNVPNAFFYKGINRFIVLKNKTNTKIVQYTKDCFDFFNSNTDNDSIIDNTSKLAQLIHIVGRLELGESEYRRKAETNLKAMKEKIEEKQSQLPQQSESINFLLRTIYVSLIWRKKDDSAIWRKKDDPAIEYFLTLIEKGQNGNLSAAAKINIGFHLDYYGDTVVGIGDNQVPNYVKEGQIKVTKCLNTLRRFSSEINSKISNNEMDEIGLLHLITFCHILRKIDKSNTKLMQIIQNSKFEENCIKWCARCYKEYHIKSFKWLQITAFLKKESVLLQENWPKCKVECDDKVKIRKYNKYSRLNEIPRTGWITRGIKEGFGQRKRKRKNNYYKKYNVPENVAEHTLNCWLLGYIFLPEDNYKQTVLDLLLVHDFAEVEVGDIIEKKSEDIQREQDEMGRFLNGGESNQLFKAWQNVWGKVDKKDGTQDIQHDIQQDIQVAYDIDKIQAMYQYFSYYAAKVISQNNNDVQRRLKDVGGWFKEYDKNLRTNIGKDIAEKVVFLNNKFSDNDELFCLFYDKYKEIEENKESNKTDAES